MKIRNKILSLTLAVCMILAMLVGAGCGNGTPSESTAEVTPSVSTPEATPEASTPEASTPEVSTPEASTPEASTPEASTPEASTPTESEPVVTPPEGTVYSISYDLDGGMNPMENPDSYTYKGEDVQLFVPIKNGYAFVGWTGTGLETPTQNVVISGDSTEDKSFKAVWRIADKSEEIKDPLADKLGELMNTDKTTPKNPNELALSTTDLRGFRGEGLFLTRTAYTDITVDGVMDAAYSYGLRFEMDMVEKPDLYKNSDTGYDVYMIRGQDGKMHVFVHVTDRDIVLNDAQWEYKWWHCDTWQMYIDFDNDRNKNDALWTFAAEPTKKYLQDNPENWIVVMTEDGFNIEFEFDNQGKPFAYGDEFSFGFFYNDSSEYTRSAEGGYKRSNTGTKSVLDPKFHLSNVAVQDTVRMTSFPLTYEGDLDESGSSDTDKGEGMIADIASGKVMLTVVTGKHTLAYNEINAEELVLMLQKMGIKAQLVREDRMTAAQNNGYKLYINAAENAEARAVLDRLDYSQYGAVVLEDKIVAAGWVSEANDLLCDVIEAIFQYAVSTDSTLVGENYVYTLDSIRGAKVPKVEGTYCIVDAGDDSYNVVKSGATASDYENYCKLLEDAGYKLHASNKMATVSTATYYNEDTVINVLYGDADGDKTMRVVVETLEKTTLPTLGKERYEPTAKSSITQVDLGAGMCYIIKLDNGEFIIVDSGNQKKQDRIYNALKELNGGDKQIVIAAWIFTHFHQDHIGGFLDFLEVEEYMKNVTVKSVMYNPPERFFLDISKQNSGGDRENIIRWPGYIAKLREGGTKVYKTRTGQKFYIGNAEIEILGTFDDLAPFYMRADSSNHTSLQFSVTIGGKKIILLGDSTAPELKLAAKRYGDYLKSDMIQLAHHGYGDGSSDSVFYQCVDAETVLHPGGSISGGAERWAANNAKTVYSYGKGNITIDFSE